MCQSGARLPCPPKQRSSISLAADGLACAAELTAPALRKAGSLGGDLQVLVVQLDDGLHVLLLLAAAGVPLRLPCAQQPGGLLSF